MSHSPVLLAAVAVLALVLWPRHPWPSSASLPIAASATAVTRVPATAIGAIGAIRRVEWIPRMSRLSRMSRAASTLPPWVRGQARPVSQILAPEQVLALVESIGPGLRCGLAAETALSVAIAADAPGTMTTGAQDPMLVVAQHVIDAGTQGRPMSSIWREQARATGSAELSLLANAWSLTEETGAPLADAVGTVAELLRAGIEQGLRLDAAMAGPRATMRLLVSLPLAGPALALALGVSPGQLYASSLARCSLAAGLLLALLGRAWVTRMVRAVGRGPTIR